MPRHSLAASAFYRLRRGQFSVLPRRRNQESLRRIEDPCVDEAGFLRFPLKRAQGTHQAEPIQDFLLTTIFD